MRFKSRTVKSDTVLPTACHRCNASSKGVVLPGRNDAEMGPQTRYTLRRNTARIIKDLIKRIIKDIIKKQFTKTQTSKFVKILQKELH